MNYFEKIEKIDYILGSAWKEQFPLSWPILFDYVERILIYRESNRPIELSNPFRADFSGTRSVLDPRFLTKSFLYMRLKASLVERKEPTLLLSSSLAIRFPRLASRLDRDFRCRTFATRTNSSLLRKSGLRNFIKADHVFYTAAVSIIFSRLIPKVRDCVVRNTPFAVDDNVDLLESLENELSCIVGNLAKTLEEQGVTQYICPYCNRYEEILICQACRRIGIPSKEICHGVNSHSIQNSDNVVPTHADFFYVWNRQFYENIRGYGDESRIRIGGYPKYTSDEVSEFRSRFLQRKRITFFSQATYDVGSRTDQVIDSEFVETERRWRRELLSSLRSLKAKYGYEIRFRYHQGEKGGNVGCDRSDEWKQLKDCGFEFSECSLEQDICESMFCLGINSSTLYESYVMGRATYQIRFPPAGSDNYHTAVPVIEMSELERVVSSQQEHVSAIQPKTELLMDIANFLSDSVSEV